MLSLPPSDPTLGTNGSLILCPIMIKSKSIEQAGGAYEQLKMSLYGPTAQEKLQKIEEQKAEEKAAKKAAKKLAKE